MSPNVNSPAVLPAESRRRRTRIHGDGRRESRTTLADGRRVNVPVNGRYESRVGWRTDAGLWWTEPIR
ncbi:hypothetical protein GCM10011608_10680 [Micromonospora sonchi]|uniref:Uncharacterized protein n=1 Tax=Micromonospora sonchi TaxID=1763543 RepID=A0A917TM16_9ACTN|nr:hypothetical protein [Micromonospora sonchi]GGM27728.1 hypothetical protein GCM10011608_10680 [Micromonospora sonchi]